MRRDSGKFIGWFSLKYAGRSPDVEIGYRLRPEAWGQGFATEGAKAMHDYGFDDLGLYRIIGVTHPGNRASQRVLLKMGLLRSRLGQLLRPAVAPVRRRQPARRDETRTLRRRVRKWPARRAGSAITAGAARRQCRAAGAR